VLIDGNDFYQNLGGIGTTGLEAAIAFEAQAITPTNISITNNTFENNGKAVLAINLNGLTITGNTITDSQDADSGALRFEGGVTNATIQSTVSRRRCSRCTRSGRSAVRRSGRGLLCGVEPRPSLPRASSSATRWSVYISVGGQHAAPFVDRIVCRRRCLRALSRSWRPNTKPTVW